MEKRSWQDVVRNAGRLKMPFGDSKDWDDCIKKRMASGKYTKEVAEKVCGKMKADLEKGLSKEFVESEPSPEKKDLKEIGPVVKAWEFEPNDILNSPRKVTGTFHVPKVDKDREIITKAAMSDAIPDFMHLPILHDFHKERVLGVVTKVWEEADAFHFNALFKATKDVDDAWSKVQKGEYDHVSIFGARLKGNESCGLNPNQRATPCISNKIRLDSISACDVNARNDSTSMTLAKGEVGFIYETETIIKALNTDSNGGNALIHGTYDGVKRGGKDVRVKEVSEKEDEDEEKDEVEKSTRTQNASVKQSRASQENSSTNDKPRSHAGHVEYEGSEVEKCASCEGKETLHKAKESLTGIYSMLKKLIQSDKKMVEKDKEVHASMEKADKDVKPKKEWEDEEKREGMESKEVEEAEERTKRFHKSKRPKITEEPATKNSTSQPVNKDIKEVAKGPERPAVGNVPEKKEKVVEKGSWSGTRTEGASISTKKDSESGADRFGVGKNLSRLNQGRNMRTGKLIKGDTMADENVIEKANLEQTDEEFVEEIVKANMKSTDEIVKASVTAAVDEIKKAFEGQIEELKKELKEIKEQPMVKAAVLIPGEDGKVDGQPLNYEAINNFLKRG